MYNKVDANQVSMNSIEPASMLTPAKHALAAKSKDRAGAGSGKNISEEFLSVEVAPTNDFIKTKKFQKKKSQNSLKQEKLNLNSKNLNKNSEHQESAKDPALNTFGHNSSCLSLREEEPTPSPPKSKGFKLNDESAEKPEHSNDSNEKTPVPSGGSNLFNGHQKGTSIPQFTIGPEQKPAPAKEATGSAEKGEQEIQNNINAEITNEDLKVGTPGFTVIARDGYNGSLMSLAISGNQESQDTPQPASDKKTAFEADLGLATGRFQPYQGASQAQEKDESNTFNLLGGANESAIENEMRETSYFKQNNEDDATLKDKPEEKPETQDDLIHISDQNTSPKEEPPKSYTPDKDEEEGGYKQAYSKSQKYQDSRKLNVELLNAKSKEQKSNKNIWKPDEVGDDTLEASKSLRSEKSLNMRRVLKTKEGIQLFKIQSRSQMKQRALNAASSKDPSTKGNQMTNQSSKDGQAGSSLSHHKSGKSSSKQKQLVLDQRSESSVFDNQNYYNQPTPLSQGAAGGTENMKQLFKQVNGHPETQTPTNVVSNGRMPRAFNPSGFNGMNQSMNEKHSSKKASNFNFEQPAQNRESLAYSQKINNLSELNDPDIGDPIDHSYTRRARKDAESASDTRNCNTINQQSSQLKNITAKFGEEPKKGKFKSITLSTPKGQTEADANVSDPKEVSDNNSQTQMFTSMSDIGFPSNIHNYNLKVNKQTKKRELNLEEDLLSAEKVQRMIDTQNNWRVRTMTIDELLHDIQDRIELNPDNILKHTEQFLDFFVQLLTDQNFKIVLNTLNIINMIIWMDQQRERHEKLMKGEAKEPWGMSNQALSKHIPLVVKKLADSKNIIRQEAIRCLSGVNEIMRSGPKKDNNFIALILPYLTNSSNWHIREELLHLLIKCFLVSKDPKQFDSLQVLDSVLQLFSDSKEKIRNLALEAIAAFAAISNRNTILETLFQLNVEKEVVSVVKQRLEYGGFPFLNDEGNVEIPYYQSLSNNLDVDSVAHSITNQTQVAQNFSDNQIRRKQSVGSSSHKPGAINQVRGNSSGRKIVVATANASYQQMAGSKVDDIMQHAFIHSKRTTSENTTNYEFDTQNDHKANNIAYSAGGATAHKLHRPHKYNIEEVPGQFDLNGSSFLPKLQKVTSSDQQYLRQHYDRNRAIGSSGVPSMGFIGMMPDGDKVVSNQHHMLFSGGNKRNTKYLHGTPGQPNNYQSHFSHHGTNLQNQFSIGSSGKVMGNHQMNNSISVKSPSIYDQNTMFDMSGNAGSLLGGLEGQHLRGDLGEVSSLNPGEQTDVNMSSLNGSTAMKNYRQTPSSFNQEQILFSAGGNRNHFNDLGNFNQGIPDFDSNLNEVYDGVNNSTNGGFHFQNHMSNLQDHTHLMSPSNISNSINLNEGSIYGQEQKHVRHNSKNQERAAKKIKAIKQNQGTFYSDGTAFTGITVTTGDTTQNRGNANKNKQGIVKFGAAGPPSHQSQGNRQLGPVKATREAFNNAVRESDPRTIQNEMSNSNLQFEKQVKMKSISQSHTGKQRRRIQVDKGAEDHSNTQLGEHQNRSFSHHDDFRPEHGSSKPQLNSAGLKSSYQGSLADRDDIDDPALLTQSAKINFIPTSELAPLQSPEKEFKKSTSKGNGVFSKEWYEQFEACNVIRRVCKHHQSLILQNGNQLQSLVMVLLKLAESLRSAVSRISLITLNDMFKKFKRAMEPSLDPTLKLLLKKGSDTNNFIAEEAERCMHSLVANCQESKVLMVVFQQNLGSRQNLVRLRLCQSLSSIVKSLGNNILFFKENDKLIVQLSKYLQDASQDVRLVAKSAFVSMAQAIMGQNELEKLLQRVLNEVQYKKVKEFLEKEPFHLVPGQGSQVDFLITNASSQATQGQKQKLSHRQSIKSLRQHQGISKGQLSSQADQLDQQPLNIQAKSILNPSARQDSHSYLNKLAQAKPSSKGEDSGSLESGFVDTLKDLIQRTQVNDWKQRLENSEALFDLVRQQEPVFQKSFKMVELADALCKLLTDSNAKIQISNLENLNKNFEVLSKFVEFYIQMFYKSVLSNLSSTNIAVRKLSEHILRKIYDSLHDHSVLMQPLVSMIQYNSNARLKPSLVDQLTDLLDFCQDLGAQQQRLVVPACCKLLEDSKHEVKNRTEKLFRKLYGLLGQQLLDLCPQAKKQRVGEICMSASQSQMQNKSDSRRAGRWEVGVAELGLEVGRRGGK